MSHEPEHYTAGEIARSAGLVGLAVVAHLTGVGKGAVERRIDRLQAGALEREAIEAELAAKEKKAAWDAKVAQAKRR
ncbi:hypothetical protein [Kitasatospora sp. NPDC047058]|uniref:hypothetical protein n=1 Tax=Kitasatospora sp. NPDC047058 TaxID=3155620 RepID=UPI0033D4DAB3